MKMLFKETQFLNAPVSILVKLKGINIFVKDLHSEKAYSSIAVTDGGIETCFKFSQHIKVPLSIDFTKKGIKISVNEMQSLKAFLPILVTE